MFKAVLFDLDGTLTDSAEGITKSVQYALAHYGIQVEDHNQLKCFVGPSLYVQFQTYARMSKEQSVEAVKKFRERFAKVGIYENAVYPGIEEVLKSLKAQGITLAIASAKPQVFVNQVLEHFHLASYFDVIVGSELDGTRAQKSEVITEVLRQLQLEDCPHEVLMVGDRLQDIQGAKECGTTSLGVAYGYGGREELIHADADYIVNNVAELQHFFTINPKPITPQEHYERRVKKHGIALKIWRALYPIGIHFVGAGIASFIGTAIVMTSLIMSNSNMSQQGLMDATMSYALLFTFIGQLIAFPFLYYYFKKDTVLRNRCKKVPIIQSVKKFSVVTWIAFYVFAACLGMGLSNLIDLSGLSQLFPGYSEISEQVFQNQNLLLSVLTVGIFAPLVEELAFRGLMYKRVKEYAGVNAGVIVSSLAFGLYHGNMVQFIFAALLGAVMAIFYEKTDNLWVPIMLHIGVNITSTLLSEFFTGYGSVGIFLLSTIVEIIVAIVLGIILWKKITKKKIQTTSQVEA